VGGCYVYLNVMHRFKAFVLEADSGVLAGCGRVADERLGRLGCLFETTHRRR
jgi:hypothetical protein